MKTKILVIFVIVMVTGCSRSASKTPTYIAGLQGIPGESITGPQGPAGAPGKDADSTVLLQDPAFIKAVADEVILAQPTTMVTAPTVALVPNKEVTALSTATCPYKETGSPQPEKVAIQIKGVDGSKLWALDLSKLPGCAVIFEGRFPWQTKYLPLANALSQAQIVNTDKSPWNPWDVHMIVDVKSTLGVFNPRPMNELAKDIVPDQYLDWFVYNEGSLWEYDPTWNMSDVTTQKPSIGQELEAKKLRDAMKPGNYLFPRVIMQPAGQMFVYYTKDAGDTAYNNGTTAGCTKTSEPERVPVYGLWNGQGYTAAIGAGSCWMSIWIDGGKTPTVWNGYQKDGDEIVTYKSKVEAWIFPSDWKEVQVNAWVSKH